jgi:hypothetical protein
MLAALQADSALTALVGSKIYSHVPHGTEEPFIAFSTTIITEAETKTTDGSEHSIELDVWSRQSSARQVNQIMRAIKNVLDRNKTFAVAGTTLVDCRLEFVTEFPEGDGPTRHGVMRFRVETDFELPGFDVGFDEGFN